MEIKKIRRVLIFICDYQSNQRHQRSIFFIDVQGDFHNCMLTEIIKIKTCKNKITYF